MKGPEANIHLEQIEEARDLVTNSLNNWQPESNSNILAFLYCENEAGVSHAFDVYTHELKSNNKPAMHLKLDHPNFNLFDLTRALKMDKLEDIKETITDFNLEGKASYTLH